MRLRSDVKPMGVMCGEVELSGAAVGACGV